MSPNDGREIDQEAVRSWCAAAAAGDSQAWGRLVGVYQGRLLAVARRKVGVDWRGKIDPDDIYQRTLADAVRSIKDFAFTDEDSFYRWMVRILDHRFIDEVRRLRRKTRDVAREASTGSDLDSSMSAMLDDVLRETLTASRVLRREEALQAMASAMSELPDDYRQVLEGYYLNQRSWGAIAAQMDRTEDAVRRLAGRAIQKLAEAVGSRSRYLGPRDA